MLSGLLDPDDSVFFFGTSETVYQSTQRIRPEDLDLYQHSVKIKVALEQALKAQRRSRGTSLLSNISARWGWVVNASCRPLYPRVPIVWEAGWACGPVWTGAKNLASIEIRSLHRPVFGWSLYRLSCPCPHCSRTF